MYAVYMVGDRYRSHAAYNTFRGFGHLTRIGKSLNEDNGVDELWKLQFDAYPEGLVRSLRVAVDTLWYSLRCIDEIVETDCPEVQAMLDTPDPERPGLTWCVRAFKERYAHWDTWSAAKGACGVASNTFINFCKAKGLAGYDIVETVTHYFGEDETPDFPSEYHTVVRVGRFRVDWTHRQFRARQDEASPLVWITNNPTEVFKPV